MALTPEKIANGGLDFESLAAVVNGPPGSPPVVTRTGREIPVLASLLEMFARTTVLASSYPGATTKAKIEAAISASNGRVVVIPPEFAAGPTHEPSNYSSDVTVIDMRPGTYLAGQKIVLNATDERGGLRVLFQDDENNPLLSNASGMFGYRPSGTLPDFANGEALQASATSRGTINNNPNGYVLCGLEATGWIGSQGGKIPYVWALHATSGSYGGSTTDIGELASGKFFAPVKQGTGIIDNAYALIAEAPETNIAAGRNMAALFKGAIRVESRPGEQGDMLFQTNDATKSMAIGLGGTAVNLRIASVGVANEFFGGSQVGGAVVVSQTGSLCLASFGELQLRLRADRVEAQYPFFPCLDELGFNTTAGMMGGSGAPDDANGSNGFFYFRSDGGAMTTIYQKRAGAWVGIV